MKSERRHELEQNELADWLARTGEQIKPYQNLILGVLILGLAAAIAGWIWTSGAQARRLEGWDRYYAALDTGSPAELEDLHDDYPDTPMGRWAALVAADLRVANACELLFSDKASANQNLKKAADLYLGVLDDATASDQRERATFGLARAYEAQVDLDKATERYQEVVDRWPDGAYAAVARDRLVALEKKSVRELYDRFAQWEPQAEFDDQGRLPDTAPTFDLDALPEGPQFNPRTTFGLDEDDVTDDGEQDRYSEQDGDTETPQDGSNEAGDDSASDTETVEPSEANDEPEDSESANDVEPDAPAPKTPDAE